MLPRLYHAIGVACLAVLCLAAPIACSSSQRRDQWYGTNEGADYQPEAGVFEGDGGDDGDSEVGDDAEVGDVAETSGESGKRPMSADVSVMDDAPADDDAPAAESALKDALSESDAELVP